MKLKEQQNQSVQAVGVWTFEIRDSKTKKLKKREVVKNIVPTVARTAMARQLAGNNSTEMQGTYVALGTGTTTPTNGDTTLETETYRKALSSGINSNNIASLTGFFTAAEVSGTFREAAIFGDGADSTASGSADTGIMYSRVAINITKSATETLTITWQLTFV